MNTLPSLSLHSDLVAYEVSIAQADTDAELIALWIGRHDSPCTRRNYRSRAANFFAFVDKPLRQVRVADVQAYLAGLADKAPATRANATAVLKSLFGFAQQVGYLQFNVGAAVKVPAIKNKLASRIMSEIDVLRLIARKASPRDAALVTLIYSAGLRRQEVCDLCWRDLASRDDAGQVTVFGKGGKTRVVLLSANTWRTLVAIRGDVADEAPIFPSRKGQGKLSASQVWRIVKVAVLAAGLPAEISTHWLRHAHASHSLEGGAPIHLVQQTLGHASIATTGRYLHARPTDSSSRYLSV